MKRPYLTAEPRNITRRVIIDRAAETPTEATAAPAGDTITTRHQLPGSAASEAARLQEYDTITTRKQEAKT